MGRCKRVLVFYAMAVGKTVQMLFLTSTSCYKNIFAPVQGTANDIDPGVRLALGQQAGESVVKGPVSPNH